MSDESTQRILERLDRMEKQVEEMEERLRALEPPPLPYKGLATAEKAEREPAERPFPSRPAPAVATPSEAIAHDVREAPREEPELGRVEPWTRPGPRLGSADRQRVPHAPPAFDWKAWLKRFHMLPPSGEGTMEVQIGAWWATRIGALLAVIGVVFFGMYVARRTPAWVRFSELSLISLGVTILGAWLERRMREYGGIVFGSGLALLYFTAFAAYAVPPVKVIWDPLAATWLQFAMVAVVFACALVRQSPWIAGAATFLGYVSCFFSFNAGLNDFALTASLILAMAACAFYLVRRWAAPFQLAVPLTYLIYGVIALISWSPQAARVGLGRYHAAPAFCMALAYPLVYLLLFALTDFAALLRNALLLDRERRLAQLCNTTAAIVLGFLVTRAYYHANLDVFYFVFGGVLVSLSAACFVFSRADLLMNAYFVKGSALVTLGLITHFEGRSRWLALAVESIVLLASAKRSRLKTTEAATLIAWLLSAGFFAKELGGRMGVYQGLPLWSKEACFAFGYLIVSAILFALYGRWFSAAPRDERGLSVHWGASLRTLLNSVINLVVIGALALMPAAVFRVPGFNETPVYALAVVAFCAIGSLSKSGTTLLAAVFPLLACHVTNWFYGGSDWGFLWKNGAIAVALTAVLIWPVLGHIRKRNLQPEDAFTALAVGLYLACLVTVEILLFKCLRLDGFLLASIGLSALLAAVSVPLPILFLCDLSLAPLVAALAGIAHMASRGFAWGPMNSVILWLAAIGAFVYAIGFVVWRPLNERLSLVKPAATREWLQSALSVLLLACVLALLYDNERLMLAFGVAGFAVALLKIWPGLVPAVYNGVFLCLCASFRFLTLEIDPWRRAMTGLSNGFLWMALVVWLAMLACGVVVARFRTGISADSRKAMQWILGAAALGLFFLLIRQREDAVRHYATALWGLCSIGLICLGLAARAKPFRLVGMFGLALCIPRVFLVDVRSTLYRIAAFCILGVALLVVGLLYSRFRAAIERWEGESG